jgi:DsbC/DsbD-like thiol-disulfide interchange protein
LRSSEQSSVKKERMTTKPAAHGQRAAIALMALLFAAGTARAEGLASDWVKGFNSQSRLIGGQVGQALYGGVEIAMPAGWKTYWRFPGESGVPPEFDWAASENLKSAKVLYPAPHRLSDPKAGDAIGYKDHVIFPVALTPAEPGKPVILRGKIAYGICKDICVPAEAELELTVAPDAAAPDELGAVLKSVPLVGAATTSPALKSWRVAERDGKPALLLEIASKAPASADAFVAPPSGLYLPLPKRVEDPSGGAQFAIDLSDGVDMKQLKGQPIDIVVVDETGQSETTIRLE